jgi:proteasome-associated ATPase
MDVTYRFVRQPEVCWSDIGGQSEAKAILQEAIEKRFDHPEAFKRFRKNPPKGLLLLGPTGCGKTMLAEAAAYSLYQRFGEVALKSGFFHIKGPEILRSLVGEQEAILRHVFILADKHFAKHGFPAVIFIDECEGIAKKRGTGISGDYHETLVQTLLALMNDTTAIVILATNRPDILDPAVVRHKRIDRKVYVRRPDRVAAEEIFKIYLKDQPLSKGLSVEGLVSQICDELFSDRYGMYKLIVQEENGSKERIFGLQHILNGAMIWGIVDEATSSAVNRQIEEGRETWLTWDDLKKALSQVYQGELLVDHSEDMKEFGENLTGKIKEVHKLYQGRR